MSNAAPAPAATGGGSGDEEGQMQFDTNSDYPPPDRPARDPVPFPDAAVHVPCTRVESVGIYDPASNHTSTADLVLVKEGDETAYWVIKTLQTAIYGKVVFAVGLRRRGTAAVQSGGDGAGAAWEVTNDQYAVKELDQQALPKSRLCGEDPLKEVQAMHYLRRWFDLNNGHNATPTAVAAVGQSDNHRAMLQTNVMMPVDTLSDARYLYLVMPFCSGGEMFEVLQKSKRFPEGEAKRFPEGEARHWMHQILNGVETMQRAGICHRDMSLENLLVHESSCLVIDLGMCLRIPHETDDDDVNMVFTGLASGCHDTETPSEEDEPHDTNETPSEEDELFVCCCGRDLAAWACGRGWAQRRGGPQDAFTPMEQDEEQKSGPMDEVTATSSDMIIDETDGGHGAATDGGDGNGADRPDGDELQGQQVQQQPTPRRRCLINPSGTCGKLKYMSPEILKNRVPFDGHAVDMWAVGVILFIMLTGYPPFDRADDTDPRFQYIANGGLRRLLTDWGAGLTEEAMDLLQRMLRRDPRERLSLGQVREHEWMANRPRVPRLTDP